MRLISRRHKVNVHNNNVTGARVVASVGGSGGGVCNISATGVGTNIDVAGGGYSLSLSSKVGGVIEL